ncbi:MAG: hypothetical protein V4687_08840 [Bacteroidota bacterium]
MNAVILFLVAICTAWFQPDVNLRAQRTEFINKVQSSNHTQNTSFVNIQNGVGKKIDFSSLEDEDDDEDQSVARKYTLLAKYYFTLFASATLTLPFSRLKDRLLTYGHFSQSISPKYILQRVLRL